MVTLDEIILQEANPFDPITFKSGNFWTNNESALSSVESIHQEAIEQITETLELVIKDHATRSILLEGESGSGKSYLLGRLKQKLNSKAFFAYIEPCPSNDYMWRHTLRYVVNSLVYTPAGKKESQLLLWLKSLPIFHDQRSIKQLLSEKRLFVNHLITQYPHVDQAQQFFGILYELTKPDKHFLACQWLKGDDLDEDDLKKLGVINSINSEGIARLILGNFGKITDVTMPIVLCFDQVESSGQKLPNGSHDISGVFNINTTLHNSYFNNFLVIINIGLAHWMLNKQNIPQSDMSRIQKLILLKQISVDQVKALWINRLHPIHSKVNPRPSSPIAPLDKQKLEAKFPGGKANLRESLNFGGLLYAEYKLNLNHSLTITTENQTSDSKIIDPLLSSFNLLWQDEFSKTKSQVNQIIEFSGIELTDMLQKTLKALQTKNIQQKLLKSPTYSNYSFSCNLPKTTRKKIGIFWYEERNMGGFFFAMKACKIVTDNSLCDILIILRAGNLGKPINQGYQLYKQIFSATSPHNHIIPSLEDVHYLRTYQKLSNEAETGDLVVNFKMTNLQSLEKLVQESGILRNCQLLQKLGLFTIIPLPSTDSYDEAKQFLLNLIQKEYLLGKNVVFERMNKQFPKLNDAVCEEIFQAVYKAGSLSIINNKAKTNEQIVYWVPDSK